MTKIGGFVTAIAIATLIAALAVTPPETASAQTPPAAASSQTPLILAPRHKSSIAARKKHAPLVATRKLKPRVTRRLRPAPAPAQALPNTAPLQAPAAVRQRPRPVRNAYDGLWSVTIYTQDGPCDAAYRYPARIYGGRVLQADNDFGYQLNGMVTTNGQISVTVSQSGQSATGYGRLTPVKGGGWWRAASGICSGTWAAVRRSL